VNRQRHPVKVPARLLLLALGFLLSACSPWRVEQFEETIQHGTQDEIIQAFGYPQRLRRLDNGDRVWEYDFVGKGARCAQYVVVFDQEGNVRSWKRLDCR